MTTVSTVLKKDSLALVQETDGACPKEPCKAWVAAISFPEPIISLRMPDEIILLWGSLKFPAL